MVLMEYSNLGRSVLWSEHLEQSVGAYKFIDDLGRAFQGKLVHFRGVTLGRL